MAVEFHALEARRLFSTYVQTNLVSDGAVTAAHTDTNLKNPWGLAFAGAGPFWVADNGTATSTAYDGTGTTVAAPVSIPSGFKGTAAPTGVAANTTSGFVVSKNGKSGPAEYVFVGEEGTISAWNPNVDPTNAIQVVDNYLANASYKGATIGILKHKPVLYAADFHNGLVRMYDSKFAAISRKGAFVDSHLPAGYAPFNVRNLGFGIIGVTFAKRGDNGDDVGGRNHGVVDFFSTSGVLLRRMRRGNFMNSPWGMTFAPASFGTFANDLLVGMFGSGRIAVFHPRTGKFMGYLNDNNNQPIHNDGLWAITPGNNAGAGSSSSLFFTAGLNDEADGLFGKIEIST